MSLPEQVQANAAARALAEEFAARLLTLPDDQAAWATAVTAYGLQHARRTGGRAWWEAPS